MPHIDDLKARAAVAGYKVKAVPPLSASQEHWSAIDPAGAVLFTGTHLKAWKAVRDALDPPAPASPYERAQIEAAQAAIDGNNRIIGLEDEAEAGTDLYHVLGSLLTWADAWNVDFDDILSQVRADMRASHVPTRSKFNPATYAETRTPVESEEN